MMFRDFWCFYRGVVSGRDNFLVLPNRPGAIRGYGMRSDSTSAGVLHSAPVRSGRTAAESPNCWWSISTGRKGVVYLVGYPIPYRTIPSHGTVSGGVTPDLLYRYGVGNYWYHPMVWEISDICRGISYCRLFPILVADKIRKSPDLRLL